MTFKVAQEICIGCGACAGTCPEVFEINDDKSRVKLDPVPPEYQECARNAADGCPVDAITA